MTWDANQVTLKISERRISKLKQSIVSLLTLPSRTIWNLASFVGQVISLAPVVGNATSLLSKYSQVKIAESVSYDNFFSLDEFIEFELKFWFQEIDGLNIRCCIISNPPSMLTIKGDASATGCGSYITGREVVAARPFSVSEKDTHSTWRELENVHFTLKSFLPFIQDRAVKFFVNNEASVRIIEKGSMKWDCHQFAVEIFRICRENRVSLHMEWIPRDKNKEADLLSRLSDLVDTDDWSLTPSFFTLLSNRWGPFTLDSFANFYNCKVKKFYSLFYVPNTSGVDAFSFNWQGEICLLVSPVALVGRCLEHLLRCRAKGVLVAPCWPSAFFWPMLQGFFSQFVTDCVRVKGSNVLQLGRNVNSLLGSKDFHSDMLALLIDCSHYR